MMHTLDDKIGGRAFDNFQFVELNAEMKAAAAAGAVDVSLALACLQARILQKLSSMPMCPVLMRGGAVAVTRFASIHSIARISYQYCRSMLTRASPHPTGSARPVSGCAEVGPARAPLVVPVREIAATGGQGAAGHRQGGAPAPPGAVHQMRVALRRRGLRAVRPRAAVLRVRGDGARRRRAALRRVRRAAVRLRPRRRRDFVATAGAGSR